MGTLRVVVGGQYGSESKGAVTGWLAQENERQGRTEQAVVRVAGPNAGHTAYDPEGRKWALRQIPVAAVTSTATLVIGAGSEIDPPVLLDEITRLEEAGIPIRDRLFIDGQATVITDDHKLWESGGRTDHNLITAIGSTGKGVGAARASRAMREADTWLTWWSTNVNDRTRLGIPGPQHTQGLLQVLALQDFDILIEGTQGYALGLHAGHYPQSTSSDCRAVDFLSMAGITPWDRGVSGFQVWVVARAYPIRVAGNSGPLLDETTWEALGLPEELTTVTQKVRRVGGWDEELVTEAIVANGGAPWVRVAFAMADQMFPDLAGLHGGDPNEAMQGLDEAQILKARRALYDVSAFLDRISELTGADVPYIGTGPNTRIWQSDALR